MSQYSIEKFENFKKHLDEVIYVMNCHVSGHPSNLKILNITDHYHILEQSLIEVSTNIKFYSDKKEFMKEYIKDVYFNGYGYVDAQLKRIREELIKKHPDYYSIAGLHDIYSQFENGYCLAVSNHKTRLKQLITDLLNIQVPLTISHSQFNISGEYFESNTSKIDEKKFKAIFTVDNWEKYVNVLFQTKKPLLNKEWEFIGKSKGDKGIICSWFKYLQSKNVIRQIKRVEFSQVLNNEIKELKLGRDGRTFDVVSNQFEERYKKELMSLIENEGGKEEKL